MPFLCLELLEIMDIVSIISKLQIRSFAIVEQQIQVFRPGHHRRILYYVDEARNARDD